MATFKIEARIHEYVNYYVEAATEEEAFQKMCNGDYIEEELLENERYIGTIEQDDTFVPRQKARPHDPD